MAEELGVKVLAVNNVAEGEVGGPKIPYNLPAWISISKCHESGRRDL